MLYICDVLSEDDLKIVNSQFIPSKLKRMEAGTPLHKAKSEVVAQSQEYYKCLEVFQKSVRDRGEFNTVYLFKDISPPLFSRYETGDFYDRHIDELLIGGIRTDHSITVFLNDPADYEGGELLVHMGDHVCKIKGEAGQAFIYPTGALHEVKPVTKGHRDVALLWATSVVDEPSLRYDLIALAKTITGLCEANKGDQKYLEKHVYPLEQVKNNILRGYGNL